MLSTASASNAAPRASLSRWRIISRRRMAHSVKTTATTQPSTSNQKSAFTLKV
jgi:hypothetical protein